MVCQAPQLLICLIAYIGSQHGEMQGFRGPWLIREAYQAMSSDLICTPPYIPYLRAVDNDVRSIFYHKVSPIK